MTRTWITTWCLAFFGCGEGLEAGPAVDSGPMVDGGALVDAAAEDRGWLDAGEVILDLGLLEVDAGQPEDDAGVMMAWPELSAALSDRCRRCHDGARRRRVDRFADLVGVMASQVQAPLVAPFEPEGSYLLAKVTGAHADFCGRTGQPLANCGRRMPPEGVGLSADQQLHLRAWIARGAPAE